MLDASLERWIVGATALLAAATLATTQPGPSAAPMAARAILSHLSGLEARVNRNPADAPALARLSEAYLAHGAPGLAEAALARAPHGVARQPEIAHLRARTLAALGRAADALRAERVALEACSDGSCSATLAGRASHGARWLEELARAGVDDPRAEPARAVAAYRRVSREVSLAIAPPRIHD